MIEDDKAEAVTFENKPDDSPTPRLEDVTPDFGKPWYKVGFLRRLNLYLLLLLITSYTSGYDGSMMNGVQSLPIWQKDFNHPTGGKLGLLATIQTIGVACSLPLAPILSDRLGRRHPVAIGSILCLVGAALQTAALNVNTFIAGRWLLGFGYGFVFNASAPLIAELAYPKHRAPMTALYNTTWYVGSIVAAWSTYGTFKLSDSWSWRIPSLLQIPPSLIQLATIYFIPESPRWLISHGEEDKARQLLVKHHAGGDESSSLVAYEMDEIVTAIEKEKIQNTRSYLDFFNSRANMWRLFIIVMLSFMGQWSGNGLISFYLVAVLKGIGITDGETQNKINGGLQVYNYVTSIAGALLVNRLGRRKMLLISTSGMAAAFLVWIALSAVNEEKGYQTSYGIGVVTMIFIFYLFYNVALNPIPLLYTMEILPFTLRAKGLTISGTAGMACGIFNGFVNPIALEAIGWRWYLVFLILIVVWFFVVFIAFPDTRNLSLEECAEVFEGPNARLPLFKYFGNRSGEDHPMA